MFSSLIYFYLFFLYISFGTFFGQDIAPASQRGVKWNNQNMKSDCNTALPLAPDLQKLQTPQNHINARKLLVLDKKTIIF